MEIFSFLLDQTENYEIGEGATMDIIVYNGRSNEVLELLLSRSVRIKITEKVLIVAAASPHNDGQWLKLMLQQGNDANVTEDVFKAAAVSGSVKNLHMLSAYCKMAETSQKWLNLGHLHRVVVGVANPDDGLELVQELLAQGVELEAPDDQGKTLLFHAAYQGYETIVQTLLSGFK